MELSVLQAPLPVIRQRRFWAKPQFHLRTPVLSWLKYGLLIPSLFAASAREIFSRLIQSRSARLTSGWLIIG